MNFFKWVKGLLTKMPSNKDGDTVEYIQVKSPAISKSKNKGLVSYTPKVRRSEGRNYRNSTNHRDNDVDLFDMVGTLAIIDTIDGDDNDRGCGHDHSYSDFSSNSNWSSSGDDSCSNDCGCSGD